jgi:hypothetical protein
VLKSAFSLRLKNLPASVAIAVIILGSFLCLSSCSIIPNADYDFMGRFSAGTSRTIIDSVKNEDPDYTYQIRFPESKEVITVDLYRMVLTNVSRDFLSAVGLRPQRTYYDLVGFVYANDKLIYTGTPDDLKKSVNVEASRIGIAISDSLQKEF